MKNLLYIGNLLSGKGKTVSTIEALGEKLKQEGYHVTYASAVSNKVFRMLDMVRVLINGRGCYDMVLIDTYSTINFYYAVIIAKGCRLFGIPYIPILHGGNLEHRLKNNKKLCEKLFGRAIMNVAPSGFLLTIFKNYGFNNVTYIPNPIEMERYPFKSRETLGYKLLWVRSFADFYNPLMALEVVKILKEQGIDASLCMVGPDKDGSLQQCKAYAKLHNLEVKFTGKLEKKEWVKLAASYDIFLNTTTIDNTPLSVLEAMALGMPVISTNVGGIPHIIAHKQNGFLVDSKNSIAMANAIQLLVTNKALSEDLSVNAREYVSKMDWNIIKNNWNNLLA